MSAFLCDAKTFDRIACSLDFYSNSGGYQHANITHALQWYADRDEVSAKKLAYDLYNLNLQALGARYGDPEEWDYGYKFKRTAPYRTLTQLYKAIGCLSYQCSEGDVPDTELFKEMEEVENALARDIVSNTKEYNDAPWG